VLEHLALEAVVIDGVGRTPRNIGSVAMVVVSRRRLTRIDVGTLVRGGGIWRREIQPEPRQYP
jgi:hypothetical protein